MAPCVSGRLFIFNLAEKTSLRFPITALSGTRRAIAVTHSRENGFKTAIFFHLIRPCRRKGKTGRMRAPASLPVCEEALQPVDFLSLFSPPAASHTSAGRGHAFTQDPVAPRRRTVSSVAKVQVFTGAYEHVLYERL
ncbi:Cubilin [Clarias magur]|uniref:Cubilin n=1 Tax=Clarias magur TaxID=1594786 RepID=A0A8J4X254_CLAMG|nr:Cubilin [Clarias magur]